MSLPTPRTLYKRTSGAVSGDTPAGVYASVSQKDGNNYISIEDAGATAFKSANDGCVEVTNLFEHKLCFENASKLLGLEASERTSKATELGINVAFDDDADALAADQATFEGLVADPGEAE